MRRLLLALLLSILLVFLFSGLTTNNKQPITNNLQPTTTPSVLGVRVKTTDCVINGVLPDSDCTPGAVFPDITKDQICTPGYSQSVRDVPDSEKKQVYADYRIATHLAGEFEVDHLISLELGGSNDISNLWPEAAEPRPGFHEKDQVENYLHREVCMGQMSLKDAQSIIAHDWQSVILK
jgi:hypothetical protein